MERIDYSGVHHVARQPDDVFEFPANIVNADIATKMLVWHDPQNDHTYALAEGSVFDGIVRFDGNIPAKTAAFFFIQENADFYSEHLVKAGYTHWGQVNFE